MKTTIEVITYYESILAQISQEISTYGDIMSDGECIDSIVHILDKSAPIRQDIKKLTKEDSKLVEVYIGAKDYNANQKWFHSNTGWICKGIDVCYPTSKMINLYMRGDYYKSYIMKDQL